MKDNKLCIEKKENVYNFLQKKCIIIITAYITKVIPGNYITKRKSSNPISN